MADEIDGVWVKDLSVIPDERGRLMEILCSDVEGFGFPVLEAMACRTPVLTSSVSSLPEVAGDAALLVDPRDEEEIADGIRRLLEDPDLRTRLVEAGSRRVERFTWEASARAHAEVFRLAASG